MLPVHSGSCTFPKHRVPYVYVHASREDGVTKGPRRAGAVLQQQQRAMAALSETRVAGQVSDPEKKTRLEIFWPFPSYGATEQRQQGTKTRPVGGGTPQDHPTPRAGYTQGHGRGWSCGHGRYIPMSVTRRLYSQGPAFPRTHLGAVTSNGYKNKTAGS